MRGTEGGRPGTNRSCDGDVSKSASTSHWWKVGRHCIRRVPGRHRRPCSRVVDLPAEDLPLPADFELVYRIGSTEAVAERKQFSTILGVGFDASGSSTRCRRVESRSRTRRPVDQRMRPTMPAPPLSLYKSEHRHKRRNMFDIMHNMLKPPCLYNFVFINPTYRVIRHQAGLV